MKSAKKIKNIMYKKFTLLTLSLIIINSALHSMSRYRNLQDVIYNHPDEPAIDHEIQQFKSDINTYIPDFDYPLGFAAYHHNEHAVASLLAHGALVDRAISFYGYQTALHIACSNMTFTDEEKRSRIINMLLKHGANVNARAEDGHTPLHLSVILTKSIKASELLLAYGAAINKKNYHENRPIDELKMKIWHARRCQLKTDPRDKVMLNWLRDVHRWNGKSQLRQLWITGAIVTARQIDAPAPRPITPPAINTCTAIVPYTKPKSCCKIGCEIS